MHEYSQSFHIGSTTALLLLLLQCLLSSVSGVYNEYLFKRDVSLGMNLQNAWLYAFNIAYNLLHVVLCETALLRDGHEFFRCVPYSGSGALLMASAALRVGTVYR